MVMYIKSADKTFDAKPPKDVPLRDYVDIAPHLYPKAHFWA